MRRKWANNRAGRANLPMQLSCIPVSFFPEILGGRMPISDWVRMAGRHSLDAIDLSILFIPDRSLPAARALRRQIQDQGMRVAMLSTYPDFTHPDPAQRRRELDAAVHSAALAQELNARLVRVTAGQAHPETERQAGIDWAIEGLTRLVECTSQASVTLVYENHAKPGAWRYTDFSQPPEIFLEIVRGTAPVGLGINFDTANATAFAEDPHALLGLVIHRLVSVHAADTARYGELVPVLLGTGVTPFHSLFRQLRRAQWDNWICIEEASRTGEAGIAAAVSFVRNLWNQTGLELGSS